MLFFIERMIEMNTKKYLSLASVGALLLILAACSNYANYDSAPNTPVRTSYERRLTRRNIRRETVPARRTARRPIPLQPALHSAPEPVNPQRDVVYPYAHTPQSRNSQAVPLRPPVSQPEVSMPAPQKDAPSPAANTSTANAGHEQNTRLASANRELAAHKTEFNAKEEARVTNITRASNSINGHVVKPGETFSYNETVGPTIERRGYKEGTIFVEGEKKKGFGGGVCQVSTTLSIAADEAGMTIIERHDHSRPVSYAKEGEEAATSYGGLDFKFKNEKPFPVVIRSSVEGGTISVAICEG